jgi:hypothetical protein
MDHYIYRSEFTLLLVWLTAPAQFVMLLVLSLLGGIRGTFARPFRSRFVLVLIAAYMCALALTVPVWLLLPRTMVPPSVLPDSWPSLPPLAFAPAWISCSTAGLGAWFIIGRWLHVSLPNPPLEPTANIRAE